jgi:DNA-binding NarL/FixJ family response regulator
MHPEMIRFSEGSERISLVSYNVGFRPLLGVDNMTMPLRILGAVSLGDRTPDEVEDRIGCHSRRDVVASLKMARAYYGVNSNAEAADMAIKNRHLPIQLENKEAKISVRSSALLECLAEGCGVNDSARALGISHADVKFAYAELCDALGTKGRTVASVLRRSYELGVRKLNHPTRRVEFAFAKLSKLDISPEAQALLVDKSLGLTVAQSALSRSVPPDMEIKSAKALLRKFGSKHMASAVVKAILLDVIDIQSDDHSSTAPNPSDLDVEIASLCALDKSNPQIGDLLYITEHTVKNRLKRMFGKYSAEDRVHLMRRLFELEIFGVRKPC